MPGERHRSVTVPSPLSANGLSGSVDMVQVHPGSGIDLDSAIGTGPYGTVSLADVQSAVAQRAAAVIVFRQSVQSRQRVRGNRGPPPLDDVAVIVVVRRLDQNEMKLALLFRRHQNSLRAESFR